MKVNFILGFLVLTTACSNIQKHSDNDTIINTVAAPVNSIADTLTHLGYATPQQVVSYAKTLIGVPYKYASTDPSVGFDCSGFITYVFNHFNIQVPRSSADFNDAYPAVNPQSATAGDLILFTGTDSTQTVVGHMGIIISNLQDSITFIHASSGKANGVTISPLDAYYKSRYVKIVRVFPILNSMNTTN